MARFQGGAQRSNDPRNVEAGALRVTGGMRGIWVVLIDFLEVEQEAGDEDGGEATRQSGSRMAA